MLGPGNDFDIDDSTDEGNAQFPIATPIRKLIVQWDVGEYSDIDDMTDEGDTDSDMDDPYDGEPQLPTLICELNSLRNAFESNPALAGLSHELQLLVQCLEKGQENDYNRSSFGWFVDILTNEPGFAAWAAQIDTTKDHNQKRLVDELHGVIGDAVRQLRIEADMPFSAQDQLIFFSSEVQNYFDHFSKAFLIRVAELKRFVAGEAGRTDGEIIQHTWSSHAGKGYAAMLDPSIATLIHDASIDSLDCEMNKFTIALSASPSHIRLVDCRALVDHHRLDILEFHDFPIVPYSVISYPWLGVPIEPRHHGDHTFHVDGAESADPVGSDACTASLLKNAPFLWVDRLCIMQTHREDKNWQITHMYRVYKECQFCTVLAGGLRRLVRLDEPTSWIHRSWTLQEAVPPPLVFVLLDWKLGPGASSIGRNQMVIEEVAQRRTALAPLSLLVKACTVGALEFRRNSGEKLGKSSFLIEASIFGAHCHPPGHRPSQCPPHRSILAPNVVAFAIIFDEDLRTINADAKNYAIWQSALVRTSSRPVDTVFSIMGLFGVQLNPAHFEENNRRGATIALAQAILNAGGTANWLGVGFRVPRDKFVSGFPTFPATSVAGVALVSTSSGIQEVSELVDPMYPYGRALIPFPKGKMDDDGYFTFVARAVRAHRANGPNTPQRLSRCYTALDGSKWRFADEEMKPNSDLVPVYGANTAVQYAALLGWFVPYFPGITPSSNSEFIRAMLLEEHSPGKFHVVSFVALDQDKKGETLAWPKHKLCVGGPKRLTKNDIRGGGSSSEDEELVLTETLHLETAMRPWPPPPPHLDYLQLTVEETALRNARWALPQRTLETYYG